MSSGMLKSLSDENVWSLFRPLEVGRLLRVRVYSGGDRGLLFCDLWIGKQLSSYGPPGPGAIGPTAS